MQSRKSRLGVTILGIFSVGLLVFFLWKRSLKKPTTLKPNELNPLAVKTSSPEGLDQLITKMLTAKGYTPQTAKYWTVISRHETYAGGPFNSNLATNYNNLFGMQYGTGRNADYPVSLRTGDFAGYYSADNSVNDLIEYLKDNNYAKSYNSIEDLVQDMKAKGYFEETYESYLAGVLAAVERMGK